MNGLTASLDLAVGDMVTMDGIRYEVTGARAIAPGIRTKKVDVYDLQAVDPDQTTLQSRTVSAAYLIYRLEAGEVVITSGRQSLTQRFQRRARRSLPFRSDH